MEKLSVRKSFFISSGIFIFFIILFLFSEKRGINYLTAKFIYSFFLGLITFFIFFTGRISFYRSIFFITSAISFIIVYKFKLWEITGNFFIAPQKNIPEVSFCHIALASNFFITFLDQLKALFLYGWDKWGFYTLGIVYIFSTLSIGQGFCSWCCFYGGIDEGMSKILKEPIFKVKSISQKIRDFPLGLLIFFMLSSLVLFEPVFCLWFCPLKMTTAILNNADTYVYKMQIIIFLLTGFIFLILLPFFIKKRTFCSFICPFGAFISIAGKINPFRIEIMNDRCIKCGKCIEVCPSFAISNEYKVNNYCTKCFLCIEKCKENAIKLSINNKFDIFNYYFFVLSAIVLGGTISSFFIPEALIIILAGKLWI